MKTPLVVLAVVLASFAACGRGSGSPETPPVADEEESSAPSEASPQEEESDDKEAEEEGSSGGSGEKVTALVIDTAFEPNELKVKVGTEVTWEQTGDQPHSVTAVNEEFDSNPKCSPLKSENCDFEGDTYSFTFKEAGTYEYYCRIHGLPTGRGMFATLTVED